jgi:hypothetical protein
MGITIRKDLFTSIDKMMMKVIENNAKRSE